jgi:mannose-6-phosphate isomerase-like protein (cupin superfamily)
MGIGDMNAKDRESRAAVIALRDALGRLPPRDGAPFAELFQHGSLSIEIFASRDVDRQQPHTRDELYVVIRGSGEFVYGSQRKRVAAGDFLFVPASLEHRFENFTTDIALWVVFYGPEGGE